MTIYIHKEIDKLKAMILKIGAMVEQNFRDAVKAVENLDEAVAKRLIDDDDHVNEFEIEIEEECLKILALHQPVAIDLRMIIAVLKINNELERINDLVVNIGDRILDLRKYPSVKLPFDLTSMSEKVSRMLSDSLDSLINTDVVKANSVLLMDDEIDQMHSRMYTVVKEAINQYPEQIDVLIQYPSLSRYLERIADLACNISEDVIYMVEGEIVRHQEEEN